MVVPPFRAPESNSSLSLLDDSPGEVASLVVSFAGKDLALSFKRRTANASSAGLVFLHGNPGTRRDFDWLSEHLPRSLSSICFDLPGFGNTAPISHAAPSFKVLAAGLLEALTKLNWPLGATVVGHSHGAGIAMAMASLAPRRVGKVVLMGSLGARPHTAYRQLAAPGLATAARWLTSWAGTGTGARVVGKLVDRVLAKGFAPDDVPTDYRQLVIKEFQRNPGCVKTMVELAQHNPCSKLKYYCNDVSCPTLFIHGNEDQLVDRAAVAELHQSRLDSGRPSTFLTIEHAGHMLPVSHAELIARHITDFADSP